MICYAMLCYKQCIICMMHYWCILCFAPYLSPNDHRHFETMFFVWPSRTIVVAILLLLLLFISIIISISISTLVKQCRVISSNNHQEITWMTYLGSKVPKRVNSSNSSRKEWGHLWTIIRRHSHEYRFLTLNAYSELLEITRNTKWCDVVFAGVFTVNL